MARHDQRPREYNSLEDLVRHPLLKFYDNPRVVEVLSNRGERGLWYSDFQFVFSKERPSLDQASCPEHGDCAKCSKAERCNEKRYRQWEIAFKDEKPEAFVMYNHKANLAKDLSRLCDARYLIKTRTGYYERAESLPDWALAEVVKNYTLKLLKKCPLNLLWSNGSAHLFYHEEAIAEECTTDFESLLSLVSETRTVLRRIALKTWLWDAAIGFREEVSKMRSDHDKLHLRWHVKDYMRSHLSSWGMNEEEIDAEIESIIAVDLGIGTEKERRIEKGIEETEEIVADKRKEISRVMGIVPKGKRWSDVYEELVEKKKKESRRDTIDLVKGLLDREESFLERFYESSMYISPNIVPRGPVVVMEYPGLPYGFSISPNG